MAKKKDTPGQRGLVAARKSVETRGELPPVLSCYALEPDDELFDSPQELEAHLDACFRHWQNQAMRGTPIFKAAITRLTEAHEENKNSILNPAERAGLVDAEQKARVDERATAEHAKALETKTVGKVKELAGDECTVDRYEVAKLARKTGVEQERLEGLIKDAGITLREQPSTANPKVFVDCARLLRELRQELRKLHESKDTSGLEDLRDEILNTVSINEEPPDSSLYAYLGVEPAAAESEITAKLARRNATRNKKTTSSGSRSAVNTLLGRLNAQVADNLLDATKRQAYDSAWIDAVAETVVKELRLEEDIFEISVLDDERQKKYLELASTEHGVGESIGRQAVVRASAELGIATAQVVSKGTLVRCADCGSAKFLDQGNQSATCQCGADLFAECFSCGSVNQATASRCPSCGTDFRSRREAEWSTYLADSFERQGLIVKALSSAREAVRLDPGFAPAQALKDKLEARDSEARTDLDRIRTMLDAAMPFGAREAFRGFTRDFPAYDGLTVNELGDLVGKIDEAIDNAEAAYRKAIGERDSASRELGLIGSLAVARDYADALEELGRIVPAPPPRVRCAIDGASVSVRWDSSPSPGELSYEVRMLQAGRKPVVVAAGADQLEHQQKVTPGGEVHFEVRTERAGANSDWTVSGGIQASYPAQDLVADCGDGQVVLRWSALPGQMLRITREGGGETRAIGTATDPPLVDKQVVNGTNYRYLATAVYGAGEVEADQVVTVEATPVPMPVPPPDVVATPEAGQVRVSWSLPPNGTVVVFRSAQPPPFAGGQELAPAELAALGAPLKPVGTGEAVDENPAEPGEVVYYLTVCCAGRYSVCGPYATFVNLLPVKDLMIDERPSDLRVQWGWPVGVSNVRVLVGHAAPSGPRDSAMQALDLSKAEYERRGALILPKEPETGVVAVFPSARIGEDFETGSIAALGEYGSGAERLSEVRFTFETKGRGRKQKARLAIEGEGRLPEVVVIARPRNIPRTRVDEGAVEIARLSDADREQVVELNGLERPLHVKAFLKEDSESANYVIQNGPLSDQVVQ